MKKTSAFYLVLSAIGIAMSLVSCQPHPKTDSAAQMNESLLLKSELLSLEDSYKTLDMKKLLQDSALAKDPTKGGPILYFRYDYTSCSECTDTVLNFIKRSAGLDIKIITNFENELQAQAWIERTKFLDAQWIGKGALPLASETSGNSYFFIYHPLEQRVSHVFIPIKTLPLRTKRYIAFCDSLVRKVSANGTIDR